MKRLLLLIAPVLLIILAFRTENNIIIKGTVKDEQGAAIGWATVIYKGSSTATHTDAQGNFSFSIPSLKGTLLVAAVGYTQQEVKINGRTEINIVLKASPQASQEVVVTAVGMAKSYRKDLSGYAPGIPVNRGVYNNQPYDRTYKHEGRVIADSITGEFDREGYDRIVENPFVKVSDNPLSTFSIDVDAASYSNIRRFLNGGQLPPGGAIRIEEMINYFHYEYPQPTAEQPFSINTEISSAPWNKDHKLLLIGLQGKKIPVDNLPASNLTFLIDVSGSMMSPDKLPLVKASMKLLVDQLREQDRISMVVYAGAAGLVLEPTSGANKIKIREAIDKLEAGGSTAGGAGIKLAYKTARENFVKNGNNRVILCTDGDFNVGESSDDAMERLIENERKSGVFLTVLGYGTGNYQDAKMQKLADKGNGNHAYIDGLTEAKKVLVNEFGGTLFTIAKDVKLQVEFNPAKVKGYRLIGYENRMLAKEDFNDDIKDAGELGSGHTVTALYEIIPAGVDSKFLKSVDPLKYQQETKPLSKTSYGDELLTVKFRYKAPDGDNSKLIEHPVKDEQLLINHTSTNFRFAAAVAEFGLLLRDSEFRGEASFENVATLAKKARGEDEEGYRSEFIRLVDLARTLKGSTSKRPEPVEED